MANIVIKEPLIPGKKIKFQLKASFFGEELLSPIIEIEVPQAIRALRKSGEKIKLIKGATQNENESGSAQKLFDAYKKFQEGANYRLRLRVPSTTAININDIVGIIAPATSPLYAMSGSGSLKRFKVVNKTQAAANIFYIDLRIDKNEYDSITPNVVDRNGNLNGSGNHFLVRIIGLNQKIRYAISVDETFSSRLVNKGNVRDVLVFAYKQYGETLTTEDKLKYMTTPSFPGDFPVLKNPPSWEFIQQYLKNGEQINQFGQTFDIGEKNNFAFFVTAVRYTSEQVYNDITDEIDTVWTGDWLQANTEGQPRWGRALSD